MQLYEILFAHVVCIVVLPVKCRTQPTSENDMFADQSFNLPNAMRVRSENAETWGIPVPSVRIKELPQLRTSMNDIYDFLFALEKRINFAYSIFNDDELGAASCLQGKVADHGIGKWCSPKLQFAMTQALTNTSSSFFFGIPCFCEFPAEFWRAMDLLGLTANGLQRTNNLCPSTAPRITASNQSDLSASARALQITVGTVWINGNYRFAMREVTRILMTEAQHHRRIHIITSNGINNSTKLPFKVESAFLVPRFGAFDALYDRMRMPQFLNEMGYQRYTNAFYYVSSLTY